MIQSCQKVTIFVPQHVKKCLTRFSLVTVAHLFVELSLYHLTLLNMDSIYQAVGLYGAFVKRVCPDLLRSPLDFS